jgi:hypothetical protein
LIRPELAEVHHDLGIALQTLGCIEEACQSFEQAIALAPKNARFYRSLIGCKRITADDPCVAAIQALAEEMATLSEEAQMELSFALGTAFAELGQPERSFPHLLKGNALKRRQIVYDEAAVLRHLERTRTAYTPEIMRHKQVVGDPSIIPVFVFGMPRSGSTLIEQILASHPKIFGAGELSDFEETATRLGAIDPETSCLLTRDDLRRIGASYVESVKIRAPAAARIVDKMPGNFRLAGLINLALPNARIIHSVRDPIDTCLSSFSKLFSGDQPYTYDLAELGRYYRAYEALMEHWRGVLPKGVMLEVQYEAVVPTSSGRRAVSSLIAASNGTMRACPSTIPDASFEPRARPKRADQFTIARSGAGIPIGIWLNPCLRRLASNSDRASTFDLTIAAVRGIDGSSLPNRSKATSSESRQPTKS